MAVHQPARRDKWMDNGLLCWAPVKHGNNLCVLPSHRVVIGVPQRKATNIDSRQKVWENSSERRRAAGVENQSASCPQLKYLGVLRWIGELERRTSFMSSLVYSSFCSSLDDFWKCIRRSSYTGTEEESRTTVSYTSLYSILDKHHYSFSWCKWVVCFLE